VPAAAAAANTGSPQYLKGPTQLSSSLQGSTPAHEHISTHPTLLFIFILFIFILFIFI
jgi:hypothetical protein